MKGLHRLLYTFQMNNSSLNVLVSDFDGTMTQRDFYDLVVQHLLPSEVPDYWVEYRAGRITHFEALRGYFAAIRADETAVLRLVEQMQIEPTLADAMARLRAANWKVVIASAGCRWYIDRLLAEAGVEIEVHANPGEFRAGEGLRMSLPRDSPYFSPTLGIDKAAIVRHFQADGSLVAFAGDGFPDVEPAKLVPEHLRFARGALASVLDRDGLKYQPYVTWSDIARALVA